MRLIDAELIYQSHAQHLLPYIDKKDIDNAPTVEVAKDCISREYVIALLENKKRTRKEITNRIYEAPSVTPKYTDEEIQKMQELEQAQLEKAYELGMQTSFEEWLSSFNTESATCCFTAVQQLKEKIENDR